MTDGPTTIEVRMYHVGFGDAFRLTVRHRDQTWKMLVDCGVHPQGQTRSIDESVKTIIADLKADFADESPHLDVVVATHRHKDHISGFEVDDWSQVLVDEVWVPFVEDITDVDGIALRNKQTVAAAKLTNLIGARQKLAMDDVKASAMLKVAAQFADNSTGNAKATKRLLSQDGVQFANVPEVRFLPKTDDAENTIDIEKCGARVHVLGPPRDPELLKKMHPPARAGWLTLNLDEPEPTGGGDDGAAKEAGIGRLFNLDYEIGADEVPELVEVRERARLVGLSDDMGLLAAASILERSVNNTSLFFVLEVHGVRLLFPGDAQEGSWQNVRNDAAKLALIEKVDFYKVGHHGSHNATPRDFAEKLWTTSGDAMVPWAKVKQWTKIPKETMLKALSDRHHRIILPTEVRPGQESGELVQNELWSQLTFTAPA